MMGHFGKPTGCTVCCKEENVCVDKTFAKSIALNSSESAKNDKTIIFPLIVFKKTWKLKYPMMSTSTHASCCAVGIDLRPL